MKAALFISTKLFKNNKDASTKASLTIAGIALLLSIVTAIIAFGISSGFKTEIVNKMKGAGGNLYIRIASLNKALEELPITNPDEIINDFIKNDHQIEHFQKFAVKSCVFIKDSNIEGLIVKGLGSNFNSVLFNKFIIKGRFIDSKNINEIVLPVNIANSLNVDINEYITAYFIDSQVKSRVLKVVGLYSTNITDVDNMYAYGNLKLIQKLNKWSNGQINGIEIFLKNDNMAVKISDKLTDNLPSNLIACSNEELFPQIFDWLNLIETNSVIILALMILVSIINLISAFFIIIIEKSSTIGLFKVFGYKNSLIRKIFIYNVIKFTIKYLLLGNIIGIGLCLIQQSFKLLKLDGNAYFINFIPIKLDILILISINLVVGIVIVLTLYVASLRIIKIRPINNLNFK